MDTGIFERSPQMAPLLVRLYDSHRLYSLAKDGSPLARAELTSAVIELLETDLGIHERELISDVLISLMRQAEKDLRQAISERLAVLDKAPLRVVLHLANDEIEIASPILRLSRVLSDLDLLYIIKSKGADYWRAIATRQDLSDSVMDVLADTKEAGTLKTLACNMNIRLSSHAVDVTADMAAQEESIAKPLLMRTDISEDIVRGLYKHVGEDLKTYIRDYFGVLDTSVTNAIDDVIHEMSAAEQLRNEREFSPNNKQILAADMLARMGQLNINIIMETLQRGQYASFVAMFARYVGLTPHNVYDMLMEPDGKLVAITCRAAEITKADLSRIYMMTQRLRSKDRIINQSELMNALSVYDRVQVSDARKMVGMRDN